MKFKRLLKDESLGVIITIFWMSIANLRYDAIRDPWDQVLAVIPIAWMKEFGRFDSARDLHRHTHGALRLQVIISGVVLL